MCVEKKFIPAMMAKSRIWAATGDAAAATIAKQARPCWPVMLVKPRDSTGLANGIYYHEECLSGCIKPKNQKKNISNVMRVCAVIWCLDAGLIAKRQGCIYTKF